VAMLHTQVEMWRQWNWFHHRPCFWVRPFEHCSCVDGADVLRWSRCVSGPP